MMLKKNKFHDPAKIIHKICGSELKLQNRYIESGSTLT